MRGTIYKRVRSKADGSKSVLFYGVSSYTDAGSGKRSQGWGHGHLTRAEAVRDLHQRLEARDAGSLESSALEVSRYLTDYWLPSIVLRVKPTTHAGYERAVRRAVEHLGSLRLRDLTVTDLNLLYRGLREQGGRYTDRARAGQNRPLSVGTVRAVHGVLSQALGEAADLGLIPTNPAKRAKPPRPARYLDTDAWSAEELSEFLRFVEHDSLYAVWRLAAATGMRRGELLGLRWGDTDVAHQTVAVRQSRAMANLAVVTTAPKSGQARVVAIDEETAEALVELRRDQPGGRCDDLVVRAPDGQPMHPARLSQLFRKLVRLSGVRRIRFHDLRHTHATVLLKARVPVKIVAERLGHADPAFTMRIYQHVLPGMQAEAAEAFAALVREAVPLP